MSAARRRLGRLPAARVAASACFMLSGVSYASAVVRIPDLQRRLALDEARLGMVLLGVAVGGLAAMPLSGWLIARRGSRDVARAATLTLAAAVFLLAWVPNAAALFAALVLVGGSSSVMAVALNTQASSIERRMRRPVISGLHALYSLGGLLGAAAGGVVAGLGIGAAWHLGTVALIVTGVALVATPRLLVAGGGAPGGSAFARPSPLLVGMGAAAFCVLLGEGAMADWTGVYMRDVARAGAGLTAAGYAAFSLMMAAGRLAGDALTVRLGARRLVRLGGAVAAAGIALAVAQPRPLLAAAGFGLVGAGLSFVYPTILAAAGRVPGATPSGAIALVSAIGYTGFLTGAPLIGFIAHATTLRAGLAVVGLTSLLVIALTRRFPAPPPSHRRARRPAPSLRPVHEAGD